MDTCQSADIGHYDIEAYRPTQLADLQNTIVQIRIRQQSLTWTNPGRNTTGSIILAAKSQR